MITDVEIFNFQSIKSLHLNLGKLTLITGDSHSGKSSVMRSLRVASSNMRGTRDIRHNAEDMSITLAFDEDFKVTLHRTLKGGDDYYKIVNIASGSEQTFRTLGAGGVPEEISQLLGINPVVKGIPSANYQDQWDVPYLLDTTPATTAKILGELTNVNAILKASSEGNRRLKNKKATLKQKEKDFNSALDLATQFSDLPSKDAAISRVEEELKETLKLNEMIKSLESSLKALEISTQFIDVLIPAGSELDSQMNTILTLEKNLIQAQRNFALGASLETELLVLRAEEQRLHETHHEYLVELGTCPTCGAEVS